MAFAAPLLMYASVAGAAAQGLSQKAAADNNAKVDQQEATIASAQGYEAEAQQRKVGAIAIGREVTAAGQAGGGYGGSAGRAIGQSAVNAELDDLNIRYKAGLQRWGYSTQAQLTRQEGNDDFATSTARAGTALLKGYSPSYQNPGSYTGLGSS